ncbi:Mn2+/Fe2 transporter [Halobacteriales archaeon QH_7_65_31]|nr:MAG: Mn2+/Fe2 transporter [Halobacteriales archaeon QH_7_65_31]
MSRTLRARLGALGPAWLAGAIAAGPATMASLLTAGSGYGYALLWAVLLSVALGTFTQYLSMWLGLLAGDGIVSATKQSLGRWWAGLLVADALLAAGLAQLVILYGLANTSVALFGGDATLWGVGWSVFVAIALAGGGYQIAEAGAKLLVSLVVLAFVGSLFVVPIETGGLAAGLVPSFPAGSPVVVAGVLGGAVHITLITMHTYTVRSRGWGVADYDLATTDVIGSMGVAFGLYSLAVFLVAGSVLTGQSPSAVEAGRALGPLVGPFAERLFLAGLLGAAVSTLGGNSIVPPYLLADFFGWERTRADSRYRAALALSALAAAFGVLFAGSFLSLLVVVLSVGLVGTPLAIALVLYLLNDRDVVARTPRTATNLAGGVTLTIVSVINVRQLTAKLEPSGTLEYLLAGFAVVVGVATLIVVAKTGRQLLDGSPDVRTTSSSE